MSKAFTKETDSEEELNKSEIIPDNLKNYITPTGFTDLQEELRHLLKNERPKIVEVVAWAAGNGDRSENGDYIYGKKRLREIDRRIRYLIKMIETSEVVDPQKQQGLKQVFFGATVVYKNRNNSKNTVTLVGISEANLSEGKISWISPVAKALMKSCVGDVIEFNTPSGKEIIEVLSINYKN